MYTNDLHNAYTYENQRRMDEIAEAANCRLAAECAEPNDRAARLAQHLPGLLAVIVLFFVKRWA